MEDSQASLVRSAAELVDWLLDEGGMPHYCRTMFPNSAWGDDPDRWPDEAWDALRDQLWQDCHDGDRYLWQPFVPMIQSLYFRQAA